MSVSASLLLLAVLVSTPEPAPDLANEAPVDSSNMGAESVAVDAELQEQSLQSDIGAIFAQESTAIDTTGWCTSKINAGRFDYRAMTDTVRIVLVDSALARNYIHPIKNVVTSPFGPRRAFWHFGIDLRLSRGDTVRCALPGIVRVIQNDRYGYGKVVVVRHSDGLETIYGHLSRTSVAVADRIDAGSPVGLGGSTGRSTGNHLHFEIRYLGEPFNPTSIIDFETYSLRSDTISLSRADFDYLTEVRKTVYHRIRRGDTLGHIARRYGTTVRKLCALNGISARTILRPGRKIVVRRDTSTPDDRLSLTTPGATANTGF